MQCNIIINGQESLTKMSMGEKRCTTVCLRKETWAIPFIPFSILRLAWLTKVQASIIGALGPRKFLWLATPTPSCLSKTCYRYTYMVNSKINQTWIYLKNNRRIHETLHSLPTLLPSVDGSNWFTAGSNPLAMQG